MSTTDDQTLVPEEFDSVTLTRAEYDKLCSDSERLATVRGLLRQAILHAGESCHALCPEIQRLRAELRLAQEDENDDPPPEKVEL